jgi:hypothetical protein
MVKRACSAERRCRQWHSRSDLTQEEGMSRINTQQHEYTDTFLCDHCGVAVAPPEMGSHHRNHCPRCLWSIHVDIRPGDRRSACRGAMEPIGIWIRENREWALIHRCSRCGTLKANRIGADDDEVALFALAARPVTEMPFPSRIVFERLETARTPSRPNNIT